MLKALFTLKGIYELLAAVNPACFSTIIWLGLEPVQDDFHYDFTRMINKTDGTVVLVEL